MAATTIEWTRGPNGEEGKSWNPMRGCSLKSPECEHCYAQGIAYRFSGPGMPFEGLINRHGKWNGVMRMAPDETLYEPLTWRKPTRVFVNSMTDLFHENAPFEWVDRIFAVMALCPQHTFIVLTKRAERMREYFTAPRPQVLSDSPGSATSMWHVWSASNPFETPYRRLNWDWDNDGAVRGSWPLPNVILGVSVGMREFVGRIDHLRETPAAVRMVSFEPLLEDVGTIDLRGIGWAVVGGESGPGAAPIHPDWARSLRDQCVAAGVPYFFKQWGEWLPICETPPGWKSKPNGTDWFAGKKSVVLQLNGEQALRFPPGAMTCIRMGKKAAGRVLDGRTWDEFPRVTP